MSAVPNHGSSSVVNETRRMVRSGAASRSSAASWRSTASPLALLFAPGEPGSVSCCAETMTIWDGAFLPGISISRFETFRPATTSDCSATR
jgi:hypothetical protein